MTNLEAVVNYYKYTDLSGDEIETLTGRQPILFSDLAKYQNINQVFGKFNYAIILYQTSSYTNGHYVAITRNDEGKIRYCDSYGIPNPLKEVQYTPYDKALPNYLDKLLQGIDYESNTKDYQSWKKTATCGRYASFFCRLRNLSLQQIDYLFKNQGFLSIPDNMVTILTLFGLKDISEYFQK
jgi:hypothetical protein